MLVKNDFSKKKLVKEKFLVKRIFFEKNLWSKKFLDPKKLKVQKLFGPKNVWFNKISFEIFGSKLILGKNKLGKFGSVTAEILLIWTNVTRSNVTWNENRRRHRRVP